MTKSSPILNNIKAIILGLVVFMGASYVIAGYSVPTCQPTGCNTDAPIDSTSVSQAKSGRLVVGTFDTAPLTQYVFAVKNALAYVQALATNSITLSDGTEAEGLVLTSADDTGLATWRAASSSVISTKMYVDDLRLYVKKNAGSVSVSVPSTYQYCAISQLGPDFANSDKVKSTCSVNQNADKSWTLLGERGDDPGFWCNIRCLSVDSKSIAVVPVTNPVVVAKLYYCLDKNVFTSPNINSYIGTYFGCSTVPSFDPADSSQGTIVNAYYTPPGPFPNMGPGPYVTDINLFMTSNRDSFANTICGNGQWTALTGYKTVVNNNIVIKYYTTPPNSGFTVPGFKCN